MARPPAASRPLWPLALSLFLSGAAGLAYQVVWVRELTYELGTTLEAVSTVLGVFMAGLGLGGFVAARIVDGRETKRLPRIYAYLELGIGAFAIAFPFLLDALAPLYRVLTPGAGLSVLRIVVTALLLLVPTTLMGATLPTLTALRERGYRDGAGGVGRSAGVLYASNTSGAVAGSLLTALLLLPVAGMKLATLGAAALNALAAGVALVSTRGDFARGPAPIDKTPPASSSPMVRAALAVAALSGAGALVSEVAWTRSLVLLIGPTAYGFSFIVSSVIFGLALGSAAASRVRASAAPKSLGWTQVGAALSSLVLIQILGRLVLPAGNLVHTYADDATMLLARELLGVAALLLAPSFFFGATFPLAVAVAAGEGLPAGAATGRSFAWNTVGALSGALAAGFVLIPRLGAESSLHVAAFLHLVAAAIVLSSLGKGARWRRLALPAVALGLAFAAHRFLPRWDRELLSGGLYKYAPYMEPGEFLDFLRQGDVLYFREDEVATVSVRRVATRLSLAIDGKVDATSAEDMLTQRLLAHVPLLLHPDPRRVIVIGLGSGVTAGSALTHPIDSLEAVEISPGVVEAAAFFDQVNGRPASDPRFRLVVGDGRNHLLLSESTWDVIVSEPSNPWMAGVSSLFTRDFFAMARSRLSPSGLFCQWAHIYNLRVEELKTIVASFTDAFESTALFLLSESDVLLVGARDDFATVDLEELDERLSSELVSRDLAGVGVRGSYGFLSLLAASTPALSEWAREAERHTDDRPVLELRAARALHEDTSRENRKSLSDLSADPDRAPWLPRPSPPAAEDLLARAEMLEETESFEWALEVFFEAVETDPRLYPAHEGLVRTAIASGRSDLAEERLRRLARGGATVETLLGLALLYRGLGRLDDAVLALGGALSLEPSRRETLRLASDVSGDRGETAAMGNFARRLLELDPRDPEAAAILAEVSLREGRIEDAARESAIILAVRPEEPRALQVHAIAHAELSDLNLARGSFEKLLGLDAEDWIQRNNLGRLELEAGNSERAARLFEEAVDLNPRNAVGYEGLAEAARRIEDLVRLERARTMLDFLKNIAPDATLP